MLRLCKHCQREYDSRTVWQLYDSTRCRLAAWAKAHRPAKKPRTKKGAV